MEIIGRLNDEWVLVYDPEDWASLTRPEFLLVEEPEDEGSVIPILWDTERNKLFETGCTSSLKLHLPEVADWAFKLIDKTRIWRR